MQMALERGEPEEAAFLRACEATSGLWLFACFFTSCNFWPPPFPSSLVLGSSSVLLVPEQSAWNNPGVRFPPV